MQLKQTILSVTLRFKDSTPADVGGNYAALEQRRRDHQESVALERIFFSTHQNGAADTAQFQQAVYPGCELRGFSARKVINMAIAAINTWVSRPPPESFAEKLVSESGRDKNGLQWLAVELREAETARPAAHIAQRTDAVIDKYGEKICGLVIGMADGEERVGCDVLKSHGRTLGPQTVFCRKAASAASKGNPAKCCYFAFAE